MHVPVSSSINREEWRVKQSQLAIIEPITMFDIS